MLPCQNNGKLFLDLAVLATQEDLLDIGARVELERGVEGFGVLVELASNFDDCFEKGYVVTFWDVGFAALEI